MAAVISVGLATLAAAVGAGGLGAVPDPRPLLSQLVGVGIKAAVFQGGIGADLEAAGFSYFSGNGIFFDLEPLGQLSQGV